MITLTIIACLASAPDQCRKHELPFDGPAFACILHGQFQVAEWQAAHPKLRVTRFRCGPVERDA